MTKEVDSTRERPEDKLLPSQNIREREKQADVLSYVDSVLQAAPTTHIDSQIVEASRRELRRIRQILAQVMAPASDSNPVSFSLREAFFRSYEAMPESFSVIEYPNLSSLARISVIQPRKTNPEELPYIPTDPCMEHIIRGMGVLEKDEEFPDLVREFDRQVRARGGDIQDPRNELRTTTMFSSAHLLIQPHRGRIDLLLSQEGLVTSLTSK